MGLVALVKDPWRLPAKTRLASAIGTEGALCFYEASLRALAQQLQRIGKRPWATLVAHAPENPSEQFLKIFSAADKVPQVGGTLGCRIRGADHELRQRGCGTTVFIGGDSPDLADDQVEAMVDQATTDAAVIASDDGGFVALASFRPLPPLDGVRWSHEATTEDLLNVLRGASMSVAVVGSWFDVDEMDDLVALCKRLELRRAQGGGPLDDLQQTCAAILAEPHGL